MHDAAKFLAAYQDMEKAKAEAREERQAVGYGAEAMSRFVAAQSRFMQAAIDEAEKMLEAK